MSLVQQFVEELDNTFKDVNDKNIVSNYNKSTYQSLVAEGTELIDQLKIEIHNITNPQQKAAVQAKIIHYKDLISKLQKQLLTEKGTAAPSTQSLNNADKGQQSVDILRQARQQLADTEAVGVDTMEHLTKQREQILKATDNTKKVNAELGYSNKLLGKMGMYTGSM